jgi:hydrogenase expression/formation protein
MYYVIHKFFFSFVFYQYHMTDLEGITKRLLLQQRPEKEIKTRLKEEYSTYRDLPDGILNELILAILKESKQSLTAIQESTSEFLSSLLSVPKAGVTMGEHGVGCRGKGDSFVHSLLAKLSKTSVEPLIAPESLDDTGAVKVPVSSKEKSMVILSKMEGMHSRLSDFPFLAGFHVTRAALRDIYVKGGLPVSIMVDVHLADDGDIGKLFDFQAGISTVAELSKVPITAGSTLRIGGDMVIGDRLTGGIAAIGIGKYSFFRKNIQCGDTILMTEGAGGGTITTTALYANKPEIVQETLNLKFIHACETLFEHPDLCQMIHAMTDVTNGGLRNDLHEIIHESHTGVKIELIKIRELINPKVLTLLEEESIDYLGVSLDSLLIFCDDAITNTTIDLLQTHGIHVEKIGIVTEEEKVIFINEINEETILPHFRESAYTPLKKIVDQCDSNAIEEKEARIQLAFEHAMKKKATMIESLQETD